MSYPQHPITPPQELVQQWLCSDEYLWGTLEHKSITITSNRLQNVATQAAQWGADMELEACCKWLNGDKPYEQSHPKMLRAARRPKSLSLKEQALQVLASAPLNADEHALIRQALEALPND